jgi:hypothetical protein
MSAPTPLLLYLFVSKLVDTSMLTARCSARNHIVILQSLSSSCSIQLEAYGSILGKSSSLVTYVAMAGSLAAVKKEMRKRIRAILKELPEAAAASQSMHRHLSACIFVADT